ncbi:MAG: YciC family protein [Spirochaetes bacterium]|jgi:hypothetical protein|nr:YciC family protein [Spirochaetota bacterium]
MELTVSSLVQNSIKKGVKYVGPLLVNVFLWGLTIWIPYLNVGTTIGLFFGLPTKMSRDEEISFTEIFDAKFRKNMGEVFLSMGFVNLGVMIGFLFFIIPGYVIFIAWSLATLLVADKNYNPIDAIKKSNDLTYGKKWTIFFGAVVLYIIVMVALILLVTIFGKIHGALAAIVGLLGTLFSMSIMLGFVGELYGSLAKDA